MSIRQRKYPDTDTFHWHNQNPNNRFTSDCVIRAISTAAEIPYENVVLMLASIQIKTGFNPSDKDGYGKLLKELGWQMCKQPRKSDGKKYTGKEFCKALQAGSLDIENSQRIIAHIGSYHITAIIDCKVWDNWDSTNGCIGNYWIKP